MTRPTARVLALLELLQSGGTRNVGELAARLAVDERTVRRYVVQLADLGIPVQTVRGRYGGYRLMPGFRLPPLMLTEDEALAVLLGLISGTRTGLAPTSRIAAESAAAKLQRVLPTALRRRLDALVETAEFTIDARPASELVTSKLLELAEAARDRKPVTIGYTAADGRESRRTVHPYGIVAHAGHWYLTAADSASGGIRTFRLDRVSTLAEQPGTFDVPDGFSPTAHLLAGLAAAPHRHAISLLVQGTAEQVVSRFPVGIAAVADPPAPDGWVRVQLRVERLDWVPGVLAELGVPFTVEYPDALRELLRSLASQLIAGADGERSGSAGPAGNSG